MLTNKLLPILLLLMGYLSICFYAEEHFLIKFEHHSTYQKKVLFDELKDVHIWAKIGETMKDDPHMQITYGEKTEGLGANFTIDGKKEHCYVSYVAYRPNQHISYLYESLTEDKEYLSTIDLIDSDNGTIVIFETKSTQKLPFLIRGFLLLSGINKKYENITKTNFINLDDLLSKKINEDVKIRQL